MVVTAGQQDTRLRLRDPVLGHDLAAMAAPVTKWSVQVERADELGPILQRAFKIANEAPKGPVFVALPIDVMEQETAIPPGRPATLYEKSQPSPEALAALAQHLEAAKSPAIVAGDDVARAGAVPMLVDIAEKLGAGVWFEGLRARNSFPTDHHCYRGTLAFDAPGVAKQFAQNDLVLLLGGPFFEECGTRRARRSPRAARCCRSRRRRRGSPTTSRSMSACWPTSVPRSKPLTRNCPRSKAPSCATRC
jgi:benzoylformate decarboxylase